LQERRAKHGETALRSARDPDVGFVSNVAERAIRMFPDPGQHRDDGRIPGCLDSMQALGHNPPALSESGSPT